MVKKEMAQNNILKIIRKEALQSKLCMVIGTRPGIIMFSPLIRECEKRKIEYFVIHTGQHYSYNMDKVIFDTLELPTPQYRIEGVASKKYHGAQTAAMLEEIEKVLLNEKPSVVLVGGDANTNLAGALAARKLGMNLGHVEAGERSYDWRMPEEHNRRMIDHISNMLFATNDKAAEILSSEKVMGITHITGNTIVDASYQNAKIAKEKSTILDDNDLKPGEYCVLTTHREENVDFVENLKGIFDGVAGFIKKTGIRIFFAAHPRTLKRIEQFDLVADMEIQDKIIFSKGPAYLDFQKLLANAKLTFTDSGGVQQESCIHKVPCVTLRENTEWTETLDIGANMLAGTNPERIVAVALKMLTAERDWVVPFGNGDAAEKIMNVVEDQI